MIINLTRVETTIMLWRASSLPDTREIQGPDGQELAMGIGARLPIANQDSKYQNQAPPTPLDRLAIKPKTSLQAEKVAN